MSIEAMVTAVLLAVAASGPAMIVASRRIRRRADPAAPGLGGAVLLFDGLFVTLVGWALLGLWVWVSTAHWGMM